VFDKSGIVEFAKRLAALKIEILSTGERRSCCAKRASACATFRIYGLAGMLGDGENLHRSAWGLSSGEERGRPKQQRNTASRRLIWWW